MLKFLVVMTGTSAVVVAASRSCHCCLVSRIHPWQQAVMREAHGLSCGEARVITAQVTKTMAMLSTASRESCCRHTAGWGALHGEGWMDEKTTVVHTHMHSSVGEGRGSTLGGR